MRPCSELRLSLRMEAESFTLDDGESYTALRPLSLSVSALRPHRTAHSFGWALGVPHSYALPGVPAPAVHPQLPANTRYTRTAAVRAPSAFPFLPHHFPSPFLRSPQPDLT